MARNADALPAPVRLTLTLREVAARLGISYWCARDLVLEGVLARVCLPGKNGRELRRVLVAVEDLENFVNEHKEQRIHVPARRVCNSHPARQRLRKRPRQP